MVGKGMRWLVLAWLAWCPIGCAKAGDPCAAPSDIAASYASRIAAIACAEHRLWYSPFLDSNGRLASITVAEAENARLQDGMTPAWRRVADYWKGSGLLWQSSARYGTGECSVPNPVPMQSAACRAFVVDTPWSATFVSFVMARSGLPGFAPSASHVDYVRSAWGDAGSPYRLADPEREPPSTGDLLCFARGNAAMGYAGFVGFLQAGDGSSLAMHCDIVVGANVDGDNRLHLVGGNVLQGVTARVLNLNRSGLLWALPKREPVATCSPANDSSCNFNRQDWVALLKLKPLPPPATPPPAMPPTAPQSCCVQCALPMPAGMRRCPPTPTQ